MRCQFTEGQGPDFLNWEGRRRNFLLPSCATAGLHHGPADVFSPIRVCMPGPAARYFILSWSL